MFRTALSSTKRPPPKLTAEFRRSWSRQLSPCAERDQYSAAIRLTGSPDRVPQHVAVLYEHVRAVEAHAPGVYGRRVLVHQRLCESVTEARSAVAGLQLGVGEPQCWSPDAWMPAAIRASLARTTESVNSRLLACCKGIDTLLP